MSERKSSSYAAAGVDIAAGEALVEAIRPAAASTRRPGADATLGGFGAVFDLHAAGFADPLLVASTDGVGTKLKIATACGRHDTIGIDLVAMCANDVLVQGAEPLFFLDYFATGHLDGAVAAEVVTGIAEGCRQAGCALVGGETAEMPGMYAAEDYDLAGFVVGAVEREELLDGSAVAAGDRLIGLASSGLHSNGFSLVRRIVADRGLAWDTAASFNPEHTLGDTLLEPTRIYVRSLLPLIRSGRIHALSHITGGGLTENIPRMFRPGLRALIDAGRWPLPPVFAWLKQAGAVAPAELVRTFNCGIGMVAAVAAEAVEEVTAALETAGETVYVIGAVETAEAAASCEVYGAEGVWDEARSFCARTGGA